MTAAAGVLITKEENGKTLVLAIRSRTSSRGVNFPCGKIEPNEVSEVTAVRECYEETGFVVRLAPDSRAYRGVNEAGVTVTIYKAEIVCGNPLHTTDEGAVVWVDPCELTNSAYAKYNINVLEYFKIRRVSDAIDEYTSLLAKEMQKYLGISSLDATSALTIGHVVASVNTALYSMQLTKEQLDMLNLWTKTGYTKLGN